MSTFTSRDGISLHERTWSPEGAPRGTAVILHGYGEHIGRYEHVAKALVGTGLAVWGMDLRGHGSSGGVRGFCRSLDDHLDDAALLLDRAAGAPRFLVAHSFGALIAAMLLIKRAPRVDGLVLSAPFFGFAVKVPALKLWAGRAASMLVPTLALPTGVRGVDVSRDPAVQAQYDSDPLNNKNATSRWLTETEKAQATVLERAGSLTLPCFVFHGTADPLADIGRTEAVFARIASTDKTFTRYEGFRHEPFNEPEADRQRVLAAVTAWLGARLT
jgi:alpha-beta hydrolase superfamily lysophospholipase